MKDRRNRAMLRRLALEALAVNPAWASHENAGQTDFVDWPEACARFAAAMSPQRVLDLLEYIDRLEADR